MAPGWPCPVCGAPVTGAAAFCGRCGSSRNVIPPAPPRKLGAGMAFLIVGAALVVFFGFLGTVATLTMDLNSYSASDDFPTEESAPLDSGPVDAGPVAADAIVGVEEFAQLGQHQFDANDIPYWLTDVRHGSTAWMGGIGDYRDLVPGVDALPPPVSWCQDMTLIIGRWESPEASREIVDAVRAAPRYDSADSEFEWTVEMVGSGRYDNGAEWVMGEITEVPAHAGEDAEVTVTSFTIVRHHNMLLVDYLNEGEMEPIVKAVVNRVGG